MAYELSGIQANSAYVTDVVLQNGATGAGPGTPLDVGVLRTVTVEITGTSTSRTVVFEGASVSGMFYALVGVKLTDMTTGSYTSGNYELWQFDVTGLSQFRTRISAVSGGNVTVKGRAVS